MIAIKDMEMPESCSDCDFCHGHICKRTGTDIITNPKGNCPLVEIVNCKKSYAELDAMIESITGKELNIFDT